MPTPQIPTPTPELVREAREAAERAAEEHGVPIDRICVIGTPEGVMDVRVLPDEDDEEDD